MPLPKLPRQLITNFRISDCRQAPDTSITSTATSIVAPSALVNVLEK
jgi:hypothetical protein